MSLESQEAATANRLVIVHKFIARLGDPRQWEFTGDVVDGGPKSQAECICGHHIRWIFMIQKEGGGAIDRSQVGSECIQHFQDYNPAMYTSMLAAHAELLKRLKADQRARAEAEELAAQTPVFERWTAVRRLARAVVTEAQNTADAYYRGWMDADSYALQADVRANKTFKTVKGRTKWLEKQTACLERGIELVKGHHPRYYEQAVAKLPTSV